MTTKWELFSKKFSQSFSLNPILKRGLLSIIGHVSSPDSTAVFYVVGSHSSLIHGNVLGTHTVLVEEHHCFFTYGFSGKTEMNWVAWPQWERSASILASAPANPISIV